MFNPLVTNLKQLKDSEIEDKIIDLGRKYAIASRSMGTGVPQQIAVVLEMYRNELTLRQKAAIDDLNKKTNKGLDGLIKVN
jgi:hypothetical protein